MAKILWGLAAVFGVLVTAIGLLWTLQGADLVHIEPIACVADCEPVEGFSMTWLVTGIATMVVGGVIAWQSVRRLKRKKVDKLPKSWQVIFLEALFELQVWANGAVLLTTSGNWKSSTSSRGRSSTLQH